MDIGALEVFGAIACSIVGYKSLLAWLRARRRAADDERYRQNNLLVGKTVLALPVWNDPGATGHPYRDASQQTPEGFLDSFFELDPDERFNRFTFAVSDLRHQFSEGMFRAMAGALDLKTLVCALEHEILGSAKEQAAIWAIGLRTSPDDMLEVARLLRETDFPATSVSALCCVKLRGPENDEIIDAVIRCVEGESRWNLPQEDIEDIVITQGAEAAAEDGAREADQQESADEDTSGVNDSEKCGQTAVDLADEILREWRVSHLDRLRDYVLNRKR